jgi:protoheme IX farnesyltransferase
MAGMAANGAAAGWVLLGALTYGVVYTVWLKRRTWLNIVVGGFAGTFAVLAGAAAVDPRPAPEAALLAIALFFWTPPHFWSLALYHKQDYVAANVPMLPVLLSDRSTAFVIAAHVAVVALFAMAAGWAGLGPAYLLPAALGCAWFLWAAVRLAVRPGRALALGCFRASLIQLTALLVGAVADGVLAGRL